MASDVFASGHPRTVEKCLSPALAPASGSTLHMALSDCVAPEGVRSSFPAALHQAVPRSGLPLVTGARARLPWSEDRRCRHGVPIGLARPVSELDRGSVSSTSCIRPKSSAIRPRDPRGQVLPRHSGLEIPLEIRPLGPHSGLASAPFRLLEAAPRRPIRQAGKSRVFHFPPKSLWTRVDNSTAHRKIAKFAIFGASLCECYRSRRANSRNRSALSLMKPSASFWS